MEPKTTFNPTNFTQNNTPSFLQKIGNICLIIATVGGLAAIAPVSTPIIVTIGIWSAFAGTVGKVLTKMSGVVDGNGQPVSQ